MTPERPPVYLSMKASLKDVVCVYDKTMKDKKRLKIKHIVLFFSILFSYSSHPLSNGFYQVILKKKMTKWKNHMKEIQTEI